MTQIIGFFRTRCMPRAFSAFAISWHAERVRCSGAFDPVASGRRQQQQQ
eukprot:COSAG06_NODE_38956_length_417_cov_11.204403_1_plen_48_part_10